MTGQTEPTPVSGVLIIDLYNIPCETSEDLLKSYRVVVVDVLRSATSVAMALHNGARDIIPTASAAAGIELSAQLSRKDVLLCGEREGKIVEGFDIGNSPADFTRERVQGRTLIFGSTNGTPMLVKASSAKKTYFAALINLNAVVKALLDSESLTPIAIVCAGQDGFYSLEDCVCGGLIISRIRAASNHLLVLNDAAVAAEIISREHQANLDGLMHSADHGRYLIDIGAEHDLTVCANDSTLSVVPVLREGRLTALKTVAE